MSRRSVVTTAGLAAGASALPLACTREKQKVSIHKRPWWVRGVDRPTLGEVNQDFGRFGGRNIFALHRELKEGREGKEAVRLQQQQKRERVAKWIREGKAGFGLRDRALDDAAWTVMRAGAARANLLSWTHLRVRTPEEMGVEKYAASPEQAANTVKAAARLYGAALVGIAPMNEKYVNLAERDRPIVFEDVEAPQRTDEKLVIPKRMKWVVALAVQMNHDLIMRSPTAVGEGAASLGYSHCAFVVATLAEFIRGLGYEAIPSVNDTAQSVPFAVDAGLGELSRLNRLITPEFGPAVRLCKVFTDLPMACDKPIDFGVVEFCKRCKKCAEACPSRALSFDDEPSFKVRGPWNNPGHKAWFEDSYKCFEYWQEVTTGCNICFASCPYTKAAEASIHDMVKAAASVAPVADPVFRVMDDAFGYGRQHDPEEWWRKNKPAFGVDSRRGTEG